MSFSKKYNLTQLVDEIKYEWVIPIKVTGATSFTLFAVWARRMPGYTYGKLVYTALQELINIYIQTRLS